MEIEGMDFIDKYPELKKMFSDFTNTLDDEEIIEDKAFEMNFDYKATNEYKVLSLKGVPILTNGNIMVLVSPPGTGKSNICEAILSKVINADCDSFGFEVDIPINKKALLIDTERTRNDLGRGYWRINKRAMVNSYERENGNKLPKVDVVSYRHFESIKEYLDSLEFFCKKNIYSFIIIDQIADFVSSVNKEEETKKIVKKLELLGSSYDVAFLVTIHPNPKDLSYKPTGHLGTQLCKKAESVFASYKCDDNSRLITTNFSEGKVRNGFDQLETAIKWDDNQGMMASTDLEMAKVKFTDKSKKVAEVIYVLFEKEKTYTPEKLCDELNRVLKLTKNPFNPILLQDYSISKGLIELRNGFYHLVQNDKNDNFNEILPF